jgi:hypothetical protein
MADLVTDSGERIPALRLTKRMLLNKSIALYGPSSSGKSIYTKHILDLLRGEVDQLIIVSPTEPVNRTFVNYADGPLIHFGLTAPHPKKPGERLDGAKGAELFIRNILDRQEMLMGIWTKANQPKVLESLFRRIPSKLQEEARPVIARLIDAKNKNGALLRKRFRSKPAVELKKKLTELEERIHGNIGSVYKHFISLSLASVWKQKLNEDEVWALTYLKMRPGIVLVFDDCAASMKSLFKKEEFRALRFRKLAYMRDDPKGKQFYHVTIPGPEEKPFCSPAIREFCTSVKSTGTRLNENNPFFASFRPQ